MSDQINQDEVERRIQGILLGGQPIQEGGEIPINLDDEVVERLSAREKLNQGEPLVEDEAPELAPEDDEMRGRETGFFQSSNPENAGVKAWSLQMPELSRGDVEPSDMDKMVYMKAMLSNIPLEWSLSIPGPKLKMKIRSLNNFEQDVIFQALQLDQEDADVAGPAQYVTRLQYYAGCMQITSFNKERQDYVTFESAPFPSTLEAAQELREKTREFIGHNHWATWQVKLTGLRIFEEKLALCNRAVLDENFWNPAGTD